MATNLSPSPNLPPWKPDALEILTKSGKSLNPEQVEYFKNLLKALKSMYSDIANVVNLMSDDMYGVITESNDQQCLKLVADDGTTIYVYAKKDGLGYTLTSTPVAP